MLLYGFLALLMAFVISAARFFPYFYRPRCRISLTHYKKSLSPKLLHRSVYTARVSKFSSPSPRVSDSAARDKLLHDKGYRPDRDRVILFDGVCNFCNAGINTILDLDKRKQFKFAALQGEAGRALLRKFGCKEDLSTMVYVEEGKVYAKSDAALMIGRRLGGSLGAMAWLAAMSIPRAARDWVYTNVIANNRYNIMGVRESCRLSSPGMEKRFLD